MAERRERNACVQGRGEKKEGGGGVEEREEKGTEEASSSCLCVFSAFAALYPTLVPSALSPALFFALAFSLLLLFSASSPKSGRRKERSADPEVAANEPRAAGGHNGSGRGVVDKAVCRSVALRAMREEINNSVGHSGLLSA
jgi:hypothetical protein